MKKIPLGKKEYALVSDEDFERLSQYSWHLDSQGYAYTNVSMHRLLMDFPKDMFIDHKDGNRINNQRENIRICTPAQNQHNRLKQKNNTTGYIGVSFKERYGYFSSIRDKGKTKFIGYFKNPIHAAMAYDIWAKELRGEYAKLNFQSIN